MTRWKNDGLGLMTLVALAACSGGPDGGKDKDPVTDTGATTGPTVPTTSSGTTTPTTTPPCDPPLSLSPDPGEVPPYQLLQLVGSGGTGDHRFALASPAEGDIHPTAGTYGAPGAVGLTDEVILTDARCTGEARATVMVVDGVALRPASAEVLPNTAFDYEILGGIGATSCSLVVDGSGATLTPPCSYQAGPNPGTDIVEVVDDAGYVAESTVVVTPDAGLAPDGYAHWVIPQGATFAPTASGGSGILDPVVLSGPASVSGGVVDGAVVGRSTVEVTDRFAGFSYTVTVDVVPPLVPDGDWVGARSADSRALGPGDLDGDGYADAILAVQELNGTSWEGGSVMVFAGGAGGVDPVPAWSVGGVQRDQALGSDIAVADVDGDGELDLILGVARDDFADTDIGGVRIYRGLAGGFFETEPSWLLHGVNSFDRAGSSVGACDLDGDGFVDVVVGADGAEDRSVVDYPSNSGALYVFRGSAGGFVDLPTTTRYGVRPNGGSWELWDSLDLGERDLEVGDFNGDGLCDVAASIADDPFEDALGGTGEGYVLVWHGDAGGQMLSPEPVRAYANLVDSSAEFGRRLAAGDFDGDGSDDLVVAAHQWTAADSNSGGAFVFLAASDDGRAPTTPVTPDEADWFATHPGGDQLGRGISVGEVDGDGTPDLLVGVYLDDEPEGNAGAVRVYTGTDLAGGLAGDRYDDAFLVWTGDEDDARLGESLAALGDVDGDGSLDVFGYATEHDFYGEDVGRGFVWSAGMATGLELSGEAAGDQQGAALAFVDVDGDGDRDAVGGAPQTAEAGVGALTGAVDAWLADATGFDPAPLPIPRGTDAINSFDRYGETLSTAGDFDGDGFVDLAIGTRASSSPSTWDPAWADPEACPTGQSSKGFVLVHRGTPSGLDPDPAFLWFPAATGEANLEALAGGFDLNGDGYDDLIAADEDWYSADGGFSVIFGQPAGPSTTILCQSPVTRGQESDARLGYAIAGLGDLNGDGCDEVAVSAYDEDVGQDDRGAVHVLWGWGGAGCPATSTKTTVSPSLDDVEAGKSLAGGGDVDGDGVPDLIVASERLEAGGTQTGGLWLVSGAYLNSLPTQGWSQTTWISPGSQTAHPLVEPGRDTLLVGPGNAAEFGRSVTLVPDPLAPGRMAVAAGVPYGNVGGAPIAGGVLVVRWDPAADTWEDSAYAVVGGESHLPPGELGHAVLGVDDRGTATVLVGAQWSGQAGPDRGAVYAAPLQ